MSKIIYNYPPKGRWIVVVQIYWHEKRRGIYPALWTDPEGDSCFSIYQISWKKIKKELFVNKRRHLARVCLRCNWQCFRNHFLWFCCKFSKKFFFYQPVNTSPILSLSRYLLVQLLHLSLTFYLSKLLRNGKPFWISFKNRECQRIFWVTGANQNARKSLSTDLVNTKTNYQLGLVMRVAIFFVWLDRHMDFCRFKPRDLVKCE